MTDPAPADRPALPPDPVQYDALRNQHARRRGLEAPYIAGGTDPELAATLARERRLVRLLVAMAAGLVSLGFVLGIVGAVLEAARA